MKRFGFKTMVALALATAGVAVSTASAVPIYGLTTQNNLFQFDTSAPGTINSSQAITGLQANEFIQGIDFRPANGLLYALGSSNQLYTLNSDPNSAAFGTATAVGGSFAPPVLNGSAFGFDFNPVIDRIRVVSDTDRNYVINPNDGSITQVTNLFYPAGDPNAGVNPNVVGSGYTNSFLGTAAESTQLYGIDSALDILVTQANSAGTLGTVGPLGVATTNLVGLDIDSTNTAFAALQTGPNSLLYTINLTTGAATPLGTIGSGDLVSDIAVQLTPIPEPTALAAVGLAGLALVRRRRA